ncbi:MAG: hypothetical protein KA313_08875 [Pseudarcicella sp.]|nr:hypothetical protein [Pseudarcicella sp.]MBP6411197.1 hypothetical protein [Pseudarcicella sp.]
MSIVSIFKIIFWSKFKVQKSTTKQKNSCVILGNGPSLKYSLDNHLDFIIQSDVFCVNLFSNSSYYKTLKPQNYLLLDGAYLKPNHELASLAVQHLIQDTSWEMSLFVPNYFSKSEYFVSEMAKNQCIKIVYFNYVIFEGFDWLKFWIFKKGWAMPQCQNVLNASVFNGVNCGYEKVYLLGADHTWHETLTLNENNEIIADDTHFYGNKTYQINQIVSLEESYMAGQFLSLHKAFKSYEVTAKYAIYRGIKVINASKRSYVDVFEKIKLS